MKEHAYTAGLFDGEGTVTPSHLHSSDKFRSPVVSVSSTPEELLTFLMSTYGGFISKHKVYKKHHKQSWIWMAKTNRAIEFLQKVIPHLKEKEKIRRAHLILSKYKSVTPRNVKYSKTKLQAKKEFQEEFFNPKTL